MTGYAQIIEERTTAVGTPSLTSTPTVAYIYGLDLISQKRGTTIHYYGYDGLGSVRYLSDGTSGSGTYGNVVEQYVFDGFGIQLNSTTIPNSFRYAGEQWDPDLGVYYLRARYYHPDLGRFWTMDTYEGSQNDPLSLHKYLYAHADPINRIDPSGRFATATEVTSSIGLGLSISAMLTYQALAPAFQRAEENSLRIEYERIQKTCPILTCDIFARKAAKLKSEGESERI